MELSNEVKQVMALFSEDMIIYSIMQSPKNYVVTAFHKDVDPQTVTGGGCYAINKKTLEMSSISCIDEEFSKAWGNVLYERE
jgi:hypothetical protein